MTKLRFLAILLVLVFSFGVCASAATHEDLVPMITTDQHQNYGGGSYTLLPGQLHNQMVVGDEYIMVMPESYRRIAVFNFDKSFFKFSYDYATGTATFIPRKAGVTEISFETGVTGEIWYHTVWITDNTPNPPTGI